jgi:hypothetical protein
LPLPAWLAAPTDGLCPQSALPRPARRAHARAHAPHQLQPRDPSALELLPRRSAIRHGRLRPHSDRGRPSTAGWPMAEEGRRAVERHDARGQGHGVDEAGHAGAGRGGRMVRVALSQEPTTWH